MKTRAITGFFFVLIMLLSFFFGPYIFLGFFSLLSIFCLTEFLGLIKSAENNPQKITALLIALLICAANASFWLNASFTRYFMVLLIPAVVAVFLAALYQQISKPFEQIAYTFLGVIYIILPFVFFMSIAFLPGQFALHLPLGFFLLLWGNDTFAYLAGRQFGKSKLFERHSPKKTWEGFFGGLLAAVIIAFMISIYFHDLNLFNWIICAAIISTFGTASDLVESMLKRSINVKDSGSILPGHGGLLDRFDGLLLSAPIVFVYLYLFSTL